MKVTTLAWILALISAAPVAAAQTNAEVMTTRDIAAEGLRALDARDYDTAAKKLGEAYSVLGRAERTSAI